MCKVWKEIQGGREWIVDADLTGSLAYQNNNPGNLVYAGRHL
jgi:hypothetical protein